MCKLPVWLPRPLDSNEYSDLDELVDAAYAVFVRDFIQQPPLYNGLPVDHSQKMKDGKEYGFWHLITMLDKSFKKARIRDVQRDRCEQVPWVKAIIENVDKENDISIWTEPRQNRVSIMMWLERLDYLVVVDDLGENRFMLVTGMCVKYKRKRDQLAKQREEYS